MRLDLERFAGWLPEQRWFGGKTRGISNVELYDAAALDDEAPRLTFALIRVFYEDGGSSLLNIPLLVDEDGSSRDALEDPQRLACLGELLARGSTVKGERGVFRFNGPALNPAAPPGSSSIRALNAEQTNTSVVLDEDVILKTFRTVEFGPNPDLELSRILTADGFAHSPAHLGEITYEAQGEEDDLSVDLGLAQRFVPGAADGWEDTLARLHALYDAADPADVREDYPFLITERAGDLLDDVELLGDATAEMHVALSRAESWTDLAPEQIDPWDLKEWAERARVALDAITDDGIEEIHPFADAIEGRIDMLTSIEAPGCKIRIHGDYHLGQVIKAPTVGWLILDFEGEPKRSLEERRSKQSPLRDVAGMLRSFSYAATAALFQRTDLQSAEWKRLEPWADAWEALVRDRFLTAYLKKSHEGTFLPADRDSLLLLLDIFEVDKALYELGYEKSHRPEWTRIPVRGITKIARRAAL